ncbi:MAG TPA: ABC transporter permease [Dongiaceae bacterium]|jgi:peptide/nickel transport system permease protein|nr:ABC transporter permease [Dongiaceae bacterium]
MGGETRGNTRLVVRRLLFRLVLGLGTLIAASLLIFLCTELLPGDVAAAILGREATPETVAALHRSLDLDRPLAVRYLAWLGGVARGDLGQSLVNHRAIAESLWPRFTHTLLLAGATSLVAMPFALLAGYAGALWPGGWFDRLNSGIAVFSLSVPEFFTGYLLILIFAVKLHILPALAAVREDMTLGQKIPFLILPAATLTIVIFAHLFRMTRIALLDLLDAPYCEMAVLKGLPRGRIILSHVLPNAVAPLAYVVTLNLAHLVLGVIVVETIFGYPGLGQWMVDAVGKRDIPAIQAAGLVFAAVFVILNMVADCCVLLGNPRLGRS